MSGAMGVSLTPASPGPLLGSGGLPMWYSFLKATLKAVDCLVSSCTAVVLLLVLLLAADFDLTVGHERAD